jgi:hypothetical protein
MLAPGLESHRQTTTTGLERVNVDSRGGIKRLLLGIEATIFGGVLVLIASGSAGVFDLVVAAVGLATARSGLGSETRT